MTYKTPRYRIELHVPGTGLLDTFDVERQEDIRPKLIERIQFDWLILNPGNVIRIVDRESQT